MTTILPIPDLIFVARALAALLIFDIDHAFITAKTLESPTLILDFPILLPSNIASSFFQPFLKVKAKIPIVIIPETGSSFVCAVIVVPIALTKDFAILPSDQTTPPQSIEPIKSAIACPTCSQSTVSSAVVILSAIPFIPSLKLFPSSCQPLRPVCLFFLFIVLKKSFIPCPNAFPSPLKSKVVIAPNAVSIAIDLKYDCKTPVLIAELRVFDKPFPRFTQFPFLKKFVSASSAALIELPIAFPKPFHLNFLTKPFKEVPIIEVIFFKPLAHLLVFSFTQSMPLFKVVASASPISVPSPVSQAVVNNFSIFSLRLSASLVMLLNALFQRFS